ncbi:hypothetical protein [Peribacillus sp. NPDC097295]|uniref:hypothetical protein n=1 Tax=Peribacillus sp. NPDC097295 TaxID=3364402 RepID=UPI0037F97263
MRRLIYFFIILSLSLLTGCNKEERDLQWYSSKEEAIEEGIKEEGADKTSILSVEEFENETIFFFEYDGVLGVASIAEKDNTYSWYRSSAHLGFEEVPSYSVAGFHFETKNGKEISVLGGKAFDPSIRKIQLTGDGEERELTVSESGLFFSILKAPFPSVDVKPIRE